MDVFDTVGTGNLEVVTPRFELFDDSLPQVVVYHGEIQTEIGDVTLVLLQKQQVAETDIRFSIQLWCYQLLNLEQGLSFSDNPILKDCGIPELRPLMVKTKVVLILMWS